MKTPAIALSLALLTACATTTQTTPPRTFSDSFTRASIVDVLTAAADWQLAHERAYEPHAEWAIAQCYIALNAFAPISGNPQKYLGAVRRQGEAKDWRPGLRPLSADDHAIAQSYFMYHAVNGDKKTIEPSLFLFDAVIR